MSGISDLARRAARRAAGIHERPSLADYIRHLATHGEYGEVDAEAEVRRLIEAASTQYSTERTRPDGRVIQVRANPVPGGGVVIIYSDITERKRDLAIEIEKRELGR